MQIFSSESVSVSLGHKTILNDVAVRKHDKSLTTFYDNYFRMITSSKVK